MYRINLQKGRNTLKPVEVEIQSLRNTNQSFVGLFENVLENAISSCASFKNEIVPHWECSCCRSFSKSNDTDFIIHLDNETTERDISNLMEKKYNSLLEDHLKEQIVHENSFELNLHSSIKSCIFHSSQSMKINLESILNFGGKSWKIVGAMSNSGESFFKMKNKWFESSEETEEILEYADRKCCTSSI